MKILANDGIDPLGKSMLEKAGFEVDTANIPQQELSGRLGAYDAITVRSATKVRKDLIDACPNLKLIGRGGVGMDNIDVEYARERGIQVVNTPASSSVSVAELVFAHLLGGIRFLYDSNRLMPSKGDTAFNALKKKYSGGKELLGATLGIIGFGRIGHEVARRAVAFGMNVLVHDVFPVLDTLSIQLGGQELTVRISSVTLDELLSSSDYITLHVPGQSSSTSLLNSAEIAKMKKGAGIINTSRGGLVNEQALLEGLNSGNLSFAALDVFEDEPTPAQAILRHERISLSPHIGAATQEAQERIGEELAGLVIGFFKRE